MRKGKLLSGRAWKRIVRVLSCIVVFCTTYALILPAITQEAQAYCGSEDHQHTDECYRDIESCTKEEHQHAEDCYDANGNLICQQEEHTHSEECTRELLDCTREEHTHTLQCFSNPEADLETEEDWKKTIPTGEELKDKTVREQIVMVSQSQKGYKESDKNYQVENETEKKGITRYGQWDQDPYEDWTGAYARFVLHYAGVDTADAKKSASDWLEQLHQAESLNNAEEAEPGDVLFVYDSSDHLKTGIVEEKMDTTIKALMGDWDNEVKEQSFNAADEAVHYIWKPVETEQKPEEETPAEPVEPKPEEEAKPEDKEEQPAEKPEEEPVVTYDFTQEVEAEDGAKIKVSWNAGTFETEDVVFQAKKVELTEEEQKKVKEQLDQDKSYTFRNYDLTFYVRNESMELVKVEPMQPVHVEIGFEGQETTDSDKVFHFADDGTLEAVEKTKDKLNADEETNIRFKGESFSVYTVATAAQERVNGIEINSVYDLNREYHNKGNRNFYLGHNVEQDSGNDGWNRDARLDQGGEVTIDLNGHSFDIKGTIYVRNGTILNLTNSNGTYQANLNNAVSEKWDRHGMNGTSRIKYADREGNLRMAEAGGLISSNSNVIDVEGENSSVSLSNGVGISSGANGITAENKAVVNLHESYICSCTTGIVLHFGAQANLNSGSVISLNNNVNGRGGGIYADDQRGNGGTNNNWFGSKIVMKSGSLISSNSAQTGGGISLGRVDANIPEVNNTDYFERSCMFTMTGGVISGNKATTYEGGGLALQYTSQSRATLYGGEFYKNEANSGEDWGGGGIFISEGNYLWMPNGASIYENTSNGLGGGLTGCSTGKIIVDPYLKIFQNQAHGTGFAPDSKKTDANKYKDQLPGYYGTELGYRGEDIYGAKITQVSGVVASGTDLINANWQGNVSTQFTIDNDGATLYSSSWLAVKCMLPDSMTDPLKQNQLIIHGNTSKTHGGGVLINGWLVTGSLETSYIGQSLEVRAHKSLKDETGTSLQMTDGQFHFKVTEENNPKAPALASGSNNGQGLITFNNKLPVGDLEKKDYIFYLMEDIETLPPGYQAGGEVWQINVKVRDSESITVYMPVWNEEQQAFVARQVTIIQRTIESVTYKKLPDGQTVSLGAVSSAEIGSVNSPSFTNLQKEQVTIIQRTIESVTYKKLPDGQTVSLGAVSSAEIGSVNSPSFTNLQKETSWLSQPPAMDENRNNI